MPDGAFLYVCGVEQSYEWANNFHMALRPVAGARSHAPTFNGCVVHARGAERLEIPEEAARALYPERDASFLTCRNFQFGAHYFGAGDAQ